MVKRSLLELKLGTRNLRLMSELFIFSNKFVNIYTKRLKTQHFAFNLTNKFEKFETEIIIKDKNLRILRPTNFLQKDTKTTSGHH
ncbi:hypothetical protein BpHYR1_039209 [Brachionus plicatilis]|uniref:Uncharacterized protein n=1 Tax=Brachionus plicatilis TaxID=10195 RepID=A0A3M7QVZ1_BRAPC|nr:hypothetical protein BpHYR1_039209 [Brachionus plicatilis]